MVGSPIRHSLSPVLHRAAYAALGLDWEYHRVQVGGEADPDLATYLSGLGPEWVGLSVTMPCKERALALADEVGPRAALVGSANTLVRIEQGWAAHNTDPAGVRGGLVEAGVRTPRRAVLLGAGATARSTLSAFAEMGVVEVTLVVRDEIRPETAELAAALGLHTARVTLDDPARIGHVLAEADVAVSTLPPGSRLGADAGFTTGVDLGGLVLLDAIYENWPTPLARWAAAQGARVLPGTEMLLHQAVEQVELMTGRPAPVAAMREALLGAV